MTAGVITIVHTSLLSVEDFTRLFDELAPEVELRHIVDSSLLPEVIGNGGVTPGVRRRMLEHFKAAEAAGADVVFSQCSSVGEVADLAAAVLRVPVVKVDAPMARLACECGRRVAVLATLPTTLQPTCRLIERTAAEMGLGVELEPVLVEEAFDLWAAGDRARHDRLVRDAIRELSARSDVVACAQGSMAGALSELGQTPVPVLTSPRLGVQRAVEVLREQLARGRRT